MAYTAEQLDRTQVKISPMSSDEEQRVADDMMRSRIQIMLNFPFFGSLIMHLGYEVDYTCKTAATDGQSMFYNPYFMDSMSEQERNWIIIHEVMHPALKHLWRRGTREARLWNEACDYAIHSIIMNIKDSNGSRQREVLTMPKGCLYNKEFDDKSAEEIYCILQENKQKQNSNGKSKGNSGQQSQSQNNGSGSGDSQTTLDDHSRWETAEAQSDAQRKQREWDGRLVTAAELAASRSKGNLPAFLKRMVDKITKPQKDWRTLLAEFVEMTNDDYSFCPPDNRFDADDFGGIMLPGFTDQTEVVKNVIFWVDTSGSIGNKELSLAYSEICGAIDQFRGKLSGKIGFFDAEAYPPTDFESVTDVIAAKPLGGGGTDLVPALKYTRDKLDGDDVAGIIVLTDGYLDFPKESLLNGKPILWLINHEDESIKPPYGIVARLHQ
jgi:predicted metal-dependent peptidase